MASKSTISVTLKLDGDHKSFEELINDSEGLKKAFRSSLAEAKQLKESLTWSQGVQAIEAVTNTISAAYSALSGFSDRMKVIQAESIAITQLTGKTGDEMAGIRSKVQAVSEYFGTDFNETLRAANALSKGFGISMEEAMSLMRDGLVSGANAGGDFIDTVREYPRYFKEAGLSAEEFIAITANAAQQGVFSDKGVDVIKEGNLRIREMTDATASALNGIGISAEKVQEGLQDGSLTTFEVMQMVASKLKELPASSSAVGTAIADIFGGPGEDAGLEYIKTLAGVQLNMETVKAATQGTAEQQERQIQMQEDLKNSMSGLVSLSSLYTDVQPYVDLTAQVAMAAMGIGSLITSIKAMNVTLAVSRVRVMAVAAAHKVAAAASATWTGVQKLLNWVLRANPIGIVITAIGALVGAVVYAYNHSERFRNIVNELWEAVKPLAVAIMNGLVTALEWLVAKFKEVWPSVKPLVEGLMDALIPVLKSVVGAAKEVWKWISKLLGLNGKKVNVQTNVTTTATTKPDKGGKTPNGGDTDTAKPDLSAYLYKPTNTVTPASGSGGRRGGSSKKSEDNGIIPQLERKIEEARKKLRLASTEEAIASVNAEIEAYESELQRYEGLGRKEGKAIADGLSEGNDQLNEKAETLREIQDNIRILNDRLQDASATEAAGLNREIALWEEKAEAIRSAGKMEANGGNENEGYDSESRRKPQSAGENLKDGWEGLKSVENGMRGITSAIMESGDAWEMTKGIVDGIISTYQSVMTVMERISGVSKALGAAKQAEATASETAGSMALTGAAQEAAASATKTSAKQAETAANTSAAVSGAMSAYSSIPFVGIALGLAAVAAILGVIMSVKKFAKGGIVSGPTLAMVGEYAGASGNPEVIAPLDKLRGMLAQPASMDFGKVEFEIKGRTLVGILSKENGIISRR